MKIFSRKRLKKLSKKFQRRKKSKLHYGMIHCRFGDAEGVSIVMKQVEKVLNKKLKVPNKNIYYLVGTSKVKSKNITENEFISEKHPANQLMLENYKIGYGGGSSEKIESAINSAKNVIEKWIKKNKIDILIAHNTSHPVNFVVSVALSRYYRDAISLGEKTPKYILWWHDSHLERESFLHPAKDVENYILQGVPGNFVEHIIFINNLQFKEAKKYFKKIDKRYPGFFHDMKINHGVIYNTTDVFINSFKDLQGGMFNNSTERFMHDFKVKELLKSKRLNLKDVFFCIQHTRMVSRKRIDFALEYAYNLFQEMRERKMCKGFYFLISGHDADRTKKKLKKLNKELSKKYKTNNFFLVFAEDYYNKTTLTFEEYPKIFAKLGAISTYFSDVEGFGNNLLEVLASGLIPAVYTYPVYKKDIARFHFKTIAFDKFELDKEKINDTISVIRNNKKRMEWVNHNLEVLRKHFPHSTIGFKLKQAIKSERTHI